MITLFGATGYTGRLIAHALDRSGLPYRIAGRSAGKLAALSAELSSHPERLIADALQPSSLPRLFAGSQMLINCAGPFTDLGEKVIAQAAMSGVHYLDMTNELGYVFRARTYDQMAKRTGAALVPACGFEVAFSDCMSALIGRSMLSPDQPMPLDALEVFYVLDGMGSSAGTRRSAVRSLATSWIAYRDGDWTGQMPGGKVRRFDLPATPGKPSKAQYGLLFPSSESVTVPAHLPIRRVDVWMSTAPSARFWAPIGIPLAARMSRSILRPLILNAAARGGLQPGQAPEEGSSPGAAFTVFVQARRGEETGWMQLTGADPYGLTAQIAVYVARQLLDGETARAGLLAPSQAMDPLEFLQHSTQKWGLTLSKGGSA